MWLLESLKAWLLSPRMRGSSCSPEMHTRGASRRPGSPWQKITPGPGVSLCRSRHSLSKAPRSQVPSIRNLKVQVPFTGFEIHSLIVERVPSAACFAEIVMTNATDAAATMSSAERFAQVFPDALKSLKEADPEVATLVEEEKKRQWCEGGEPLLWACVAGMIAGCLCASHASYCCIMLRT